MKKLSIGFVVLGAIIGLRPLARRLGQKMRAHCEQMVAQFGGRDEAARTTPSPAPDVVAAPETVAA